jgi:hypothetical protein
MNYFSAQDSLGYDASFEPSYEDNPMYMNRKYLPSLDYEAGYAYQNSAPEDNMQYYYENSGMTAKKKKTNWAKVAGYTTAIAGAALAYRYRGKIAKTTKKGYDTVRGKLPTKISTVFKGRTITVSGSGENVNNTLNDYFTPPPTRASSTQTL